MTNKTVVILDDEKDILELIAVNLKKNGFKPVTHEYVGELWNYLLHSKPDLIILDLMLNDADGVEVCKQLRESERYGNIPIIMLTAKSEEIDKIIGLEIGADDYMTKPFSPRELIARIKAILRRTEKQERQEEVVSIRGLEINFSKHEVLLNRKKINLTQTEFKLLKLLIERKNRVCTREQLLNYLWGEDKIVIDRTIDVHIKNLREKLKDHKDLIKNIRGVGYKIEL
jgi:two-component system phosphate regulon response regulator PhoB/two-component system alkaline phosphatase synthesis response regulator PhoP